MLHGVVRIHDLHVAEGELEAAGAQLVGNLGVVAHGDVEVDLRVRSLKLHDALGQVVAAGVRRGDDVDGVFVLVRAGQRKQAVAVELQHLPGVGVVGLAVGAQLHAARGAVQQPRAQLGLQVADVNGHHGLGDLKAVCGIGEAALVHHGHKRFQLLKIHRCIPP